MRDIIKNRLVGAGLQALVSLYFAWIFMTSDTGTLTLDIRRFTALGFALVIAAMAVWTLKRHRDERLR